MPLTDTRLKGLKPKEKPTKHSDGGGLHVLMTPTGSKLWRLSYRLDGKQQTMALGSYPAVTLAEARKQREQVKSLLAKGINPSHHAKLEQINRQSSNATTFKVVAEQFLEKLTKEEIAETTRKKKEWLLSLAMPDIGARPISEITAAEVLVPLRRIEGKGNYETARRVRSTVGQIFRFAISSALATNDPTFGLKGALISPTVIHRAAITKSKAFGGLLRSIWDYEGMPETRIALQLMAFLYPRPGELRQAEWSEIDFDKATWTLPAERMKMRREHRKPLSKHALAILAELRELTGHGRLMFPAVTSPKRTMSENTMNSALRRMGYSQEEATSHGFRASASTLLNESGKWSPDAIEAELAHFGADEVRKAYHRALYWVERVKMPNWWAEYLDELRGS